MNRKPGFRPVFWIDEPVEAALNLCRTRTVCNRNTFEKCLREYGEEVFRLVLAQMKAKLIEDPGGIRGKPAGYLVGIIKATAKRGA